MCSASVWPARMVEKRQLSIGVNGWRDLLIMALVFVVISLVKKMIPRHCNPEASPTTIFVKHLAIP